MYVRWLLVVMQAMRAKPITTHSVNHITGSFLTWEHPPYQYQGGCPCYRRGPESRYVSTRVPGSFAVITVTLHIRGFRWLTVGQTHLLLVRALSAICKGVPYTAFHLEAGTFRDEALASALPTSKVVVHHGAITQPHWRLADVATGTCRDKALLQRRNSPQPPRPCEREGMRSALRVPHPLPRHNRDSRPRSWLSRAPSPLPG